MISYRAMRILRRLIIFLLVMVLVASALLLCWVLWLNRYVVYTRDGAILDFNLPLEYAEGVKPQPPEPAPTVEIHYWNENNDTDAASKELTRFSGYYVTLEELTEDFDNVSAQLEALPTGSTILLNMKSLKGTFYYSTALGPTPEDFDVTRVDSLIQSLKRKGHYLIARIPAFQDYNFGLNNVPFGLPRKGAGGALWLDRSGPIACYWLNPVSDGTLTYLIQIISELRSIGFREVVLADFRFPDTDQIVFEGDKDKALTNTAATLVKTCSTDSFCVSFTRQKADLSLPEGRTRLYLENVAAADAATMAGKTEFIDPSIHVVFLTETGDTRYDSFCVLRPIDTAH